MKALISIIIIIGLVSSIHAKTNNISKKIDIEYVRYDYLGSYKAIISKPKGNKKFPIIIYSYDEFYDWAGKDLANRRGYNLEYIAAYFAQRGYVCIIPIERYRKVKAIIGVSNYIKNKPYVNPNSIHLIGMSEGAFLNIIAAETIDNFASMTLIGGIEINDKGHLSNSIFKYKKALNPNLPIYFMLIHDVSWRIKHQKKLYTKLQTFYKNITYKRLFKEKRWFWDIDRYGKDINLFILKQYNQTHETRQNTYKPPQYQPSF
ncbi:hypothetical protein CL658_02950 [bacterium]|nr:hypothetical protein [bacterium]|tara:strand:- start:475 stop:1257 length:783 start_codon:yes stop_codon:yes gene_type:complete